MPIMQRWLQKRHCSALQRVALAREVLGKFELRPAALRAVAGISVCHYQTIDINKSHSGFPVSLDMGGPKYLSDDNLNCNCQILWRMQTWLDAAVTDHAK
jgi:hypothetical protein